MWVLAFIFLIAAAAQGNSENPSWKPNTVYEYAVEGRTLTALHQVSDQYSGMVVRATVQLQAKTSDVITMQVRSAEYSDVHTKLPLGWSSSIPESQLHFQHMQLRKTPIELNYRKGIIRGMTVSKNMPTWELNLMKSFTNQMQVDTRAENLIKSRMNSLPSEYNVNAVYKTMEESIGGLCETIYDTSPLPPVVLTNQPELAPLPHLQPGGQLVDIVKTRNFSNCQVPVEYHFGITGLTDWKPSSNQMGKFLARSSMSRIIISSNPDRYIIQSSVTTSKVIASPFLFEDQNGMVVSRINLTLVNVKSANGPPQSLIEPKTITNLVYEYNPASPDEKVQLSEKQRQQKKLEKYSDSHGRQNLDEGFSSGLKKYPNEKRLIRSVEYENNSSINDRRNETRKLSHREWLMQFRPDIIEKIMAFQNDKKTASLIRDPLFPSSEYSSSPSSEDSFNSTDNVHLNHTEWLKKFRPDIYNKVVNSQFFNLSKSSSSSSSSDSSYDSSEGDLSDSNFSWESNEEITWHPDMNEAPHAPFLPMFIGNKGNSIQSAKEIQVMSAVRKIAQEIGHDFENPSSIPGQMTLSKFAVLTEIVETMNVKQMSAVIKELYFPQSQISSSSDFAKYHAWIALRDAVAQAGTGPALIALKEMIESKKVQGEEAAQLVSVLPNSAHFPNTEYMNIFFMLTTSKVVTDQDLLNTSAAISFTELARKAFVSKSSAYKPFPVNVFGPVMPKREQPVIQKYVPYFARSLKEAVKNADSNKIRTMITALGNLAHPRILSVFEPYLEGREPMSQFQRLAMVVALNRMAKVFPNAARPVLFRIYQNTGETSEVRVAAVFQIMKTNPPAQMLQRMAQFTNDDLDLQVVSAVQSAIRSAATLSSPTDHELMMNAQAAVDMLNPKEHPPQMSRKKVHTYWAKQLNLAYKQAISYIGSGDSFMPSNLYYSLRRDLGGFKRQTIGFSAMSSSLEDMVDLTMNQISQLFSSNQSMDRSTSWRSTGESSSSSSWAEKINKIFSTPSSTQDQVEASLYMTTLLGKRYFTIDNHTIKHLPQMVMKAASALRSGKTFNYTKLTDKMSVTIGFPVAMGLPFVFTLKTPTLMMLAASVRAQNQPNLASGSHMRPQAINMTADLHLVYSSRSQSQMGFTAPFNKQHYVAGVSRNIQVNIPLKSEINIDLMSRKLFTKVEPLDGDNIQNLIEYSTVPYTAKRDILDMVESPQKVMQPDGDNKKVVHVRAANQIHKTFGQDSTGLAFDFNYSSEQKFIDFAALYIEARKHDLLSAAIYAWAEDSIHFNNITLAFNPQKSTAKYAKFSMAYMDDSDKHNDRGLSNSNDSDAASASMAQAESTAFDSRERQQQFLYSVSSGIQDSSTMVLDLSAEFQGQSKASFVATFAAATSYTSPKARYLFFANRNAANLKSMNRQNQMCMAAETLMPNVPLMNFAKALDVDPTSYMSAEMTVGERCSQPSSKISIKGKMRQSQDRHKMMGQMPLAQLCKEQMQEGNSVLSACRNVTMHATCLDQYKYSLQFDKISEFWKNMTYKAYSALRFAGYQYVSEDLISHNNPDNTMEVDADFAPDLTSLNVTVRAPMLSALFTNLRVNRMIQPLLVVNPEYSAVQRAAEYIFQGQQFPTCVVDSNRAETFDNKSYPVNLGQCWHLMMQYNPTERNGIFASDNMQNMSVLVRDAPSNNNKEVIIIMGRNTILLEPYQVTVNDQPVKVQQGSLSQAQDHNGQILAQMYQLPSGAIRLFTQENTEFQYDGSAVKIRAPNSYRSKVQGLCGTFNSQSSDDFIAPTGCMMQDPFEFAATYAVVDANCKGPSKALNVQAQQSPCLRNKVVYSNVVADSKEDASLFDIRSKNKQNKRLSSTCTQIRTKVVEREEKICFTLRAQVQCAKGCKPQSFATKQVDFFCIESSSVTQNWRDAIRQGKMPNFSHKKASMRLSINIPESCVPV